uniref:DNA cross-link repair 1A n=1 Tax=Oryctolagus cuniculus TaxID=9986 RepID=A0A5F9D3X8_RABIT
MLEDATLEEEIWEYKSKRKPKPVHPRGCSENIPESSEQAADGRNQPKPNRNKKRTKGAKAKVKDHERHLGETDCQTCIAASQGSDCGDGIPQSQDTQGTPRKRGRTRPNKQVSPKTRPVYSGHCPNCQMPFSSLLGQTPRWHVFECLDSPSVSETECPDGLLCTSTIPSHYKRYTHLLLAQSRAGNSPPSSPACESGGSFSETNSGLLCSLEEKRSLYQKQTGNLKNVPNDPLLMTECLKKSHSPTETDKKISSTNSQMSQQVLQFTDAVKKDELVGAALPLADEMLSSQSNSKHTNLSLPENDVSNCEISYSPLQSEEDTSDTDEKLDDSQQDLFCTESSKDGSLEDDGNSTPFEKLHGSSLQDQEDSVHEANSFLTQDKYSEELYRSSALNNLSQLIPQNNESVISYDESASNDPYSLLFPPALTEASAASNYQAPKTKLDKPEFHPSQRDKQKEQIEESAVHNQASLPALTSEVTLHPSRSQRRALSGENLSAKNNANSACSCRKTLDNMPGGGKVTVLNRERIPSTLPATESLKILPSGPKCDSRQLSTKVMKQTDIGVYFGLPPKRKEEKSLKSALEGVDLNQAQSPNAKRSRQCKRKAEKSLSDLEFDAKNVNESQLSVEIPIERSQRQRKRHKKSNSLQEEEVHQKRSDHLASNPLSRTVDLSEDQVFVRSAYGGLQRRNSKISESSDARELRKRTCPFYKKIPGTGFTVDAFQYGMIEGCSAYFLTHFHSDHYAGLSKNSTFPVYCTEITGNLLKNKLHVQEQYIHTLPMDTECVVNGVKVVLLDANQYCSPEYTFPSQQEVIQFAINTAFEAVTLNPRALVVCGTYSIGKEKVFLAIADVLGSKVGMSQEKYKTLRCLNIPEINSLITTDMCNSLVHLLPMMQINFKGLQSHLKKFGGKYDEILAFRPTGWTHSDKLTTMADVIPQTKGNISIYGIPYSEHSSFLEMKRFVQWLKPQKIIPTVNVGTWKSRSRMDKYFKEWKLEAGY